MVRASTTIPAIALVDVCACASNSHATSSTTMIVRRSANQALRFSEDAFHHGSGELAGVRVLTARVIAADQRGQPVAEPHDLAVTELRPRRQGHAAPLQ